MSVAKRFWEYGIFDFSAAFPLKKVLTPKLLCRMFRFIEPFSSREPADKFIFPFTPCILLSKRIILIIPPVPWESYFAPGFVIASTLLIWLAGMEASASARLFPKTLEGLPLIRKRILELPCNSTLPSTSTVTWGTFLRTSIAAPPWEVISFDTL